MMPISVDFTCLMKIYYHYTEARNYLNYGYQIWKSDTHTGNDMHISFVNSIVSPKLRLVNKALPNRRLVWHQLISDGLHLTKIKALPDLLIQIVNPVVNVDEKNRHHSCRMHQIRWYSSYRRWSIVAIVNLVPSQMALTKNKDGDKYTAGPEHARTKTCKISYSLIKCMIKIKKQFVSRKWSFEWSEFLSHIDYNDICIHAWLP